MTPDRLNELQKLYQAALDLRPAERFRFLAESCSDEELRAEVQSLLRQRDRNSNPFERPAVDLAADLLTTQRTMTTVGATVDHYEILSLIGKGGMGEVYRARDVRLNRTVALKLLKPTATEDDPSKSRFLREARLAATLEHPNICTIFDAGESDGHLFIAMQYVDGRSLRQAIDGRPMDLPILLPLAIQIASALAAAHRRDIIHRDIKPENIIVTPTGEAKILDFGLAKLIEDTDPRLTRSDCVVGTPAYMSPEQARREHVDERTDIFSFGVVLYELVTGRLPFEGSGIYEIMTAILSDREAPPLSRYSPAVPAELERIVNKLLRKNRNERYQTIKDLLVDLQSLKQQLEGPHPARPATEDKAVKGSRVPSRRKQLLGVLAILLLVSSVIVYVWWRQQHALSSQPEIKSLAVLPLKSLDAGENYLGLGIADAAIRRVSQTGRVIVRPTSAVRRYLNEDTDALAAAKQLGVDSVLEGSFQRADDRLRVSVNLLRSRDGASLWTDNFDLRMADIFTIQDTVAQQVASRLRLQLDASQQAQLTKRYTSNPIAYDFYLKGAFTLDQRMAAGAPAPQLKIAIDLFKRAIEVDPNFALAHAQLAHTYAVMAVFIEPTQPAWLEHAKDEINRAQELDPQLAETHLARFQVLYSEFAGWQGEAAAREVRLANQLNANVGHEELVYIYTHLGLEDLAARELARWYEIDPTSDAIKASFLLMYEMQSKYDEYAADRNVRHDGRPEVLYFMSKGRFDEAQKAIDEWSAKLPNHPELTPTQALLFALKRDFRAAEAEIPIVLGKHPLKDPMYHHAAYDIARIYALEGKSAETVKWLREAADSGYHLYPRYLRDPYLDHIRQAREFIQFLAEMKAQNDRYRHEFS